jgi:hypothetical protein
MKGLQEKNEDGIFLQIKHGCICQESKSPRDGFVPIDVPNPRTGATITKYIKRYKGVEALIKKIEWYDREHDDTHFMGWKLVLDANGTACTLDFPFESRVGDRFMKSAENIDFSKPVEFSAWKSPDDKTALAIKQGGQNVPQKYTRENPGECPAPTKGFNGKWNFDKQKEFLHQRMVHVVIPRVQAVSGNGQPAEPSPSNGNGESVDSDEVLNKIKQNLKDYAAQEKISDRDAMDKWFKTRVWTEVEQTDPATLEKVLADLEDAVIPF